jgi:cell division protein ZapA (FtsZ GTPase activity inhibitor)
MKIKFTLLLVLLTILITSCQPKTVAEIREQEDIIRIRREIRIWRLLYAKCECEY